MHGPPTGMHLEVPGAATVRQPTMVLGNPLPRSDCSSGLCAMAGNFTRYEVTVSGYPHDVPGDDREIRTCVGGVYQWVSPRTNSSRDGDDGDDNGSLRNINGRWG